MCTVRLGALLLPSNLAVTGGGGGGGSGGGMEQRLHQVSSYHARERISTFLGYLEDELGGQLVHRTLILA